MKTPLEILLIESNPAVVRIITEIFNENKWNIGIIRVKTGMEAMDYLHKKGEYKYSKIPSLILLELNLPGKDGYEVLNEIKVDNTLKYIPVIVLTNSSDDMDVFKSYEQHANAYMTKPFDLDKFMEDMFIFMEFWFNYATLPKLDSAD